MYQNQRLSFYLSYSIFRNKKSSRIQLNNYEHFRSNLKKKLFLILNRSTSQRLYKQVRSLSRVCNSYLRYVYKRQRHHIVNSISFFKTTQSCCMPCFSFSFCQNRLLQFHPYNVIHVRKLS